MPSFQLPFRPCLLHKGSKQGMLSIGKYKLRGRPWEDQVANISSSRQRRLQPVLASRPFA
jgi:hypothetical protein